MAKARATKGKAKQKPTKPKPTPKKASRTGPAKRPAQSEKQVAQKVAKKKAPPTFEDLIVKIRTALSGKGLGNAVELANRAAKLATKKDQRTLLQTEMQRHGNRELWAQKWEHAAALYDAGIAAARKGDDMRLSAEMLAECGFALLQLHKLDDAEVRIRSALELHDEAKRADGGANAMYYLSSVVFERGQLDRAVELGREAVRRSTEAGDTRGATFHAYSVARALYEQGHSREAEEISKAAIEQARALGLSAVEGNFENMIANVALDDHRLLEGRQHYERALELFRAAKLKGHEAITISNLGNLAWDEDRLEDALVLYEEAIKLQKSTKDARAIGIAITARAGVLIELGRFDEAQKDLESALATMTRKGHERRVSFVRSAFARLAEARGELAEARAHYAEAEISLEVVGDSVEIGRMLYAAAGLEADLGDPESAEALLARAAALDPASLSPDKTGVGEKRAGMHAVRALRELAIARIEVARSKQVGGDDSIALRRSATSRLQAITGAKNSLMTSSSEVRRSAARLVAQLAVGTTPEPAVRYAGTSTGTGWQTELTGEVTLAREHGELIATGRLAWDDRTAELRVRGRDVGGVRMLRGTLSTVGESRTKAAWTWHIRFEIVLADKLLRGRLIEVMDEGGEDEICVVDWKGPGAEPPPDRFGVFGGTARDWEGKVDVVLEGDQIVLRGDIGSSTLDGSLFLRGPDTGTQVTLEGTWNTLPSGRDNEHPTGHRARAELELLGTAVRGTVYRIDDAGHDHRLHELDWKRV